MTPFAQTYFHGTKADLKMEDFIETGPKMTIIDD
jgi:hypothetical protein